MTETSQQNLENWTFRKSNFVRKEGVQVKYLLSTVGELLCFLFESMKEDIGVLTLYGARWGTILEMACRQNSLNFRKQSAEFLAQWAPKKLVSFSVYVLEYSVV